MVSVDTHRYAYAAAALDVAGGTREVVSVASDALSHGKLLAHVEEWAKGRRLWAIEGVGSLSTGLAMSKSGRATWATLCQAQRPRSTPARA